MLSVPLWPGTHWCCLCHLQHIFAQWLCTFYISKFTQMHKMCLHTLLKWCYTWWLASPDCSVLVACMPWHSYQSAVGSCLWCQVPGFSKGPHFCQAFSSGCGDRSHWLQLCDPQPARFTSILLAALLIEEVNRFLHLQSESEVSTQIMENYTCLFSNTHDICNH